MIRRQVLCLSIVLACFCARAVPAQFEVSRLAGHDQLAGEGECSAIDGDIAVIGVPYNSSATYPGAAYVFVRVGGNWTEEAKLQPLDPVAGAWFGSAVAIEGNRIVVGAFHANGNVANCGAAYIFRRTGVFPFATWTQQAKLVASDGSQLQQFGIAVALNGNNVLVGAPSPITGGAGGYVFTGSGTNWTQLQKLTNGSDRAGGAVSIQGATALIATPNWGPSGAVYVWEQFGTTWVITSVLLPQVVTPSLFGYSLALDGDTAIVGAPSYTHTPAGGRTGAAYVFFRQAGTWSSSVLIEPGTLVDEGRFGSSLALEGSHAVVSMAPSAAYVFHVSSGVATEIGKAQPKLPDPVLNVTADIGAALAISGDTVIAAGDESVVFSLVPPATVTYCAAKLNSQGCLPSMSFQGTASVSSATPFMLSAQSVLNNKFGILFFGVSGRTAFPFQGGTLCVLPPTRRTGSLSSAGNVGVDDCSGTYAFDFNALVQSGTFADLDAGTIVDCQYWSRDPGSPSTTGLTNAVEFGIGF